MIFFDLMDSFIEYLNITCYAGIHNCDFHYTLYKPGRYYKSYLDQLSNTDNRQFSMIMYFNESWNPYDGGELRMHTDTQDENISPT